MIGLPKMMTADSALTGNGASVTRPSSNFSRRGLGTRLQGKGSRGVNSKKCKLFREQSVGQCPSFNHTCIKHAQTHSDEEQQCQFGLAKLTRARYHIVGIFGGGG